MKYYDLKKNWTKKVVPHLDNDELNEILVKDFNKFTFGRWRQKFTRGKYPRDFESCDWDSEMPEYWDNEPGLLEVLQTFCMSLDSKFCFEVGDVIRAI